MDRDREVLTERLCTGFGDLPPSCARDRWTPGCGSGRERRRAGSRRGARRTGRASLPVAAGGADGLLAEPPLRPAATRSAAKVVSKAVLRDNRRLARCRRPHWPQPAGRKRDEALHGARKAAKRTRYAAEASRPALGPPAKKFAKRIKRVQQLLGDHQDSVVARGALRELATQAHQAGEGGSPSVCSTGARRPWRPTGNGAAGPVEEGLAAQAPGRCAGGESAVRGGGPPSGYARESPPASSQRFEMSAESVFPQLEALLPHVQKPIQYVGGELELHRQGLGLL